MVLRIALTVVAVKLLTMPYLQIVGGLLLVLGLGLAISIPMVVFGSTMMIRLMERFPVVVTLGAALIGWVGGETMANDTILAPLMQDQHWLHQAGPVLGIALVLGLGRWLQKRSHAAAA